MRVAAERGVPPSFVRRALEHLAPRLFGRDDQAAKDSNRFGNRLDPPALDLATGRTCF